MLLGLGECSACLIQVGAFFLVPTRSTLWPPLKHVQPVAPIARLVLETSRRAGYDLLAPNLMRENPRR